MELVPKRNQSGMARTQNADRLTHPIPDHSSDLPHHPDLPPAVPVLGLVCEVAIRLLGLYRSLGSGGLVHLASSESRADRLARALRSLAPDANVILFPPWDCLPYDRASPSREVMGRRIEALAGFAESSAPSLVITTPSALLQRVPPRDLWRRTRLFLRIGDALDPGQVEAALSRIGYVLDERVDEAGEAAIRGQVIDVFPAGAKCPVRIEHADGRVTAIREYDAATQLTTEDLSEVTLLPASECIATEAEPFERAPGIEHRLPDLYPHLDSLFDYLPDAALSLDVRAEDRLGTAFAQIADAFESRSRLRPERMQGSRPIEPRRLYLDEAEWTQRVSERRIVRFEPTEPSDQLFPVPTLAHQPKPFQALAGFLREQIDQGQRVVLTAASPRDLQTVLRHVRRDLDAEIERVDQWDDVLRARTGAVLTLEAEIDHGFGDRETGTTVVTAADVLGSRARSAGAGAVRAPEIAGTELELRFGDAVIHWERGLGLLQGSETIETDGSVTDLLRLTYADEATLMVPVEEMNEVWRYGSGTDGLSLDRLDGESWAKRRAKVEAEIAESAGRLVEMMRERESASAPKLLPPRAQYERFVAGFPYTETADQLTAIEETLKDLASGHPMNRLVCGDVGFGKTEVALRAAAAAALAGKQVAVAAPTTVLVRQHVETFTKRFAGLGIEVAQLSCLVKPAEARAVKEGLASGAVQVVIGTHALAAKGVRFKDLGLVIVDEEQRFGTAHKASLRALGQNVHVLTLTATPIPRTLQAALVGLQDMSVIATPPARRQPIRTFLVPFDDATIREALLRERGRGGQSFVVCPRVEDIEPLAARLSKLVPELQTFVAHGKMPAEEIDDVMVRFADGEGDVLLATNIIESGLDVPRANTMLVWRPEGSGCRNSTSCAGGSGAGA